MKLNNLKCPNNILNRIAGAAAAGQHDDILVFDAGSPSSREIKALRKRLSADQSWEYRNFVAIHSSGVPVPAIAVWMRTISVNSAYYAHRFKLLKLYTFEHCAIFAIPACQTDRLKTLPGFDFSQTELDLIALMANNISTECAASEQVIEVKHPARNCLKARSAPWLTHPLQEQALIELLQTSPVILDVMVAALDAQLRAFKFFRTAPHLVYNFTISGLDVQAESFLLSTLRAINFTCEATFSSTQPIVISLKDETDLNRWKACVERLTVIRTATGTLLNSVFEQLEEEERIHISGGQLQSPWPTVPIVWSKVFLRRQHALDVELPKKVVPLTCAEQDLLRSAFSKVVNPKTAQNVYYQWRKEMSKPTSYRADPFSLWRNVLGQTMLRVFFHSPEHLDAGLSLLRDNEQIQIEAELNRTQTIKRAIELISDIDQYEREVIERPSSKETATKSLNKSRDAVAFRFSPTKGDDCGKQLLAFTKDSLLRLLARVSCDAMLYDVVLSECERLGILDQRNRTIKLGDKTLSAVTFKLEK